MPEIGMLRLRQRAGAVTDSQSLLELDMLRRAWRTSRLISRFIELYFGFALTYHSTTAHFCLRAYQLCKAVLYHQIAQRVALAREVYDQFRRHVSEVIVVPTSVGL